MPSGSSVRSFALKSLPILRKFMRNASTQSSELNMFSKASAVYGTLLQYRRNKFCDCIRNKKVKKQVPFASPIQALAYEFKLQLSAQSSLRARSGEIFYCKSGEGAKNALGADHTESSG